MNLKVCISVKNHKQSASS